MTSRPTMTPRCQRWLSAILIVGVVAFGVGSCGRGFDASLTTGSRITPDYFQFAEVVPEGKLGGWRAVCIMASVGQRYAQPHGQHINTRFECPVEVGTPISNKKRGFIPVDEAQRIAADVANRAAYQVLHSSRGVTGTTCRRIINTMNVMLKQEIAGASVARCGATKSKKPIPVVYWPRKGSVP